MSQLKKVYEEESLILRMLNLDLTRQKYIDKLQVIDDYQDR